MNCRVLVPVKSLVSAKSRLAKHISFEERKNLVLQMLKHVITVLQETPEVSHITVVTPDTEIMRFVSMRGISIFREGMSGYNHSLTSAASYETSLGNDVLLTIAADLPLVTRYDITHMIKQSFDHDILLVPAKDDGTNAVLMRKPSLVPYLFGKNSFEKYKQAAVAKGLRVGVYESNTTAFDVDTVEDLTIFRKVLDEKDFFLT